MRPAPVRRARPNQKLRLHMRKERRSRGSFPQERLFCLLSYFCVFFFLYIFPIRTFLRENDLKGKTLAAFACQSGAGAEKAFRKLVEAAGKESLEAELILIDPKEKPSEENERKIREFCDTLK